MLLRSTGKQLSFSFMVLLFAFASLCAASFYLTPCLGITAAINNPVILTGTDNTRINSSIVLATGVVKNKNTKNTQYNRTTQTISKTATSSHKKTHNNSYEKTHNNNCNRNNNDSNNTGHARKDKRSAASKLAGNKKANQMWLTLMAMTVFLVFIFLVFLFITFIRLGRHYRKHLQIGGKNEPTEYVDAWSQYRLPEDYADDYTDYKNRGDSNNDNDFGNDDGYGNNTNNDDGSNDDNSGGNNNYKW